MPRIKALGIIFVAALGAAAICAASASAAGHLIIRTAKGPLGTAPRGHLGGIIEGSGSFEFETSAGTVECAHAGLETFPPSDEGGGGLRVNDKSKDKAELGWQFEQGGKCTADLAFGGGLGRVHLAGPVGYYFTSAGHGGIEPPGNKEESFVGFGFLDGEGCGYYAKLKFTFTPGATGHPAPMVLTVDQKFKSEAEPSKPCPKTGVLKGSFALTSAGETLESEL